MTANITMIESRVTFPCSLKDYLTIQRRILTDRRGPFATTEMEWVETMLTQPEPASDLQFYREPPRAHFGLHIDGLCTECPTCIDERMEVAA